MIEPFISSILSSPVKPLLSAVTAILALVSNIRITSTGDTRVTSTGDIRVTN